MPEYQRKNISANDGTAVNLSLRKLGLLTCTSVVVANMIGTGVFTSLGYQVGPLPSGFVILVVWALGAVFSLAGALSYAELAGALPRSGGEYHFLREVYHPSIGFMAGFISATVGFAAPIALAAMAFGEYFGNLLPNVSPLLVSICLVTAVAGVHGISIGSSQVFQNVFTVIKVLLILVFIGAGFLLPHDGKVSFAPSEGDGALIASTPFAVALMFVMYAYSGWNASTYIIGEVKDPARNVPWSLILGTSFVGVLYVLLNAVFLMAAPMAELEDAIDIGSIAATALFGEAGGRLMSGLICLGLIASISAMTWAGPRVSATIGEDFASLGWLSQRTGSGIPWVASLLQYGIVLVLLLTSTFKSVLLYTQFALVLCGLLTVVGVIVLRIRRPDLPRPFRCWGYPFTPILFSLIAIFTLVYSAKENPTVAFASSITLVAGLLIYLIGLSRRRAAV